MTRNELHRKLVGLLGSDFVYYQPPANVQLHYDCIIYDLEEPSVKRANNGAYVITDRYTVKHITTKADNDFYRKMLNSFTHCRVERTYKTDNLYHTIFDLYV